MILILEILAILFMLTMMFILIWSFVILNKLFGQLRYRNYLLEKINHTISLLGTKNTIIPEELAAEKAEEDFFEEESDSDPELDYRE